MALARDFGGVGARAQRKYCLRGKRRCGARGRCRAEVLSRSPGVFDRSSPPNSRVTRIRREDFIDVVILASKSYFSKIPGNGNAIGK